MRIGPALRMQYTFDNGEFETVSIPDVAKDPLKFKDDQKYTDRLKKARAKTGDTDAMSIGVGNIRGIKTVVLVQNFAFMGGSLGMAAGEGFITAAEYAVAHNLPLVALCDPTTGGVTASYAMLGDVHLAEPGALICFAGPRVIEETIREKLPEGFQRAEYLEEHGMIDRVVARKHMRKVLGDLLAVLTRQSAEHCAEPVPV